MIRFARGPITDTRGIGRVTSELLSYLETMEVNKNVSSANNSKVYFYSSIHWCPDTLPHPCVVMVHDVIPMLFSNLFPDEIVSEWVERFKPIAQQADRIVTISQSSAVDIARKLDIPVERIEVIYNGVTKIPIREASKVVIPANPFLVYVGSNDKHKNIDVVLKALNDQNIQNVQLVLIGDNKGLRDKVKEVGIENRVHFLGRIDDGDMGWVISQADGLVFPSFYEGFGLPPLEAALLGTPSICSERPAMTEILKGAALFANPEDPYEWSRSIEKIVSNKEFNTQLMKKAQQAANNYSWHTTSQHLFEILENSSQK